MQTQQPAAPESFATFVFFKCYFLFSALLLKQLLLMVNIYSSAVEKKAQVLDRRADRVLSRQGEVDSVFTGLMLAAP